MNLRPPDATEVDDVTGPPALLPLFELEAGDPTVSDLLGPSDQRPSGAYHPGAESSADDVLGALDQVAIDRHPHASKAAVERDALSPNRAQNLHLCV